MNRQQVLQLGIAVTLIIFFSVRCGTPVTVPVSEAPAVAASEQPAATPATQSTSAPPTVTPTPAPPTTIPEPEEEITNGQYSFFLSSVEFFEELSFEEGEKARPEEGFVFLKAILQPTGVAEDYPGLSDLLVCYRDHKSECQQSVGRSIVRGTIENIFVADSQGQKYNAIFVDEEQLIFIVPIGDKSFRLHFLDFSTLEL